MPGACRHRRRSDLGGEYRASGVAPAIQFPVVVSRRCNQLVSRGWPTFPSDQVFPGVGVRIRMSWIELSLVDLHPNDYPSVGLSSQYWRYRRGVATDEVTAARVTHTSAANSRVMESKLLPEIMSSRKGPHVESELIESSAPVLLLGIEECPRASIGNRPRISDRGQLRLPPRPTRIRPALWWRAGRD